MLIYRDPKINSVYYIIIFAIKHFIYLKYKNLQMRICAHAFIRVFMHACIEVANI